MRRRVLYFHHGGAIGGAPLSLLYLLEHLDRAAYEPFVIVLKPGPVAKLFRDAGIETRVTNDIFDFSHTELEWYGQRHAWWRLPLQVWRYPSSVRACRRQIRRLKPDLVHLNSSTLAAAAEAARLEGVPVVWHIREPIAHGYLGVRRAWLRRRIDRDAARVIAISEYDAGRLHPSLGVRVIANFVDWSRFDRRISRAEARRMLDIPESDHVVTMLGGVSRSKGTLTFIGAIPHVLKRLPDTTFLIAGPPLLHRQTGFSETAIRRLLGVDAYDRRVRKASAEGVATGHLRFIGVRTDIPQVLAATDVLAFPATVPHFGRPLIEAAAMAIPVVASRLGPSSELVADGVTGRLVPPGDENALASAIIDLLSDAEAARRMGEAGYQRARERFDAATNANRTFDVYREILG